MDKTSTAHSEVDVCHFFDSPTNHVTIHSSAKAQLAISTMNACGRRITLQFIRPLAAPCMRHSPNLLRRLPPVHLLVGVRGYATPPPMLKPSDMDMSTYHTISDETMDSLLESLEALVDSLNDPRYEVEYHSGVLTLALGDKGTYVINKQPPNKQIWLSSPISGPKRYDFSKANNAWFYSRDEKTLGTLLKEELEATLGREIELGLT